MNGPPGDRAPVAVVIATHNRSNLLADCLRSVKEQTCPPAATVIVDDGSDDDTERVVRQNSGGIDVHYIQTSNRGVAAARNIALPAATVEYICVLDDDDALLPWAIESHVRNLECGVDVSYGGWVNFTTPARSFAFFPGKEFNIDVFMFAGLMMTHGGSAYRSALLRTFPYRESLRRGSDFELNARLVTSGARFRHCDDYVLLRRLPFGAESPVFYEDSYAVRAKIVENYAASIPADDIQKRSVTARAALGLTLINGFENSKFANLLRYIDRYIGEALITIEVGCSRRLLSIERLLAIKTETRYYLDVRDALSFDRSMRSVRFLLESRNNMVDDLIELLAAELQSKIVVDSSSEVDLPVLVSPITGDTQLYVGIDLGELRVLPRLAGSLRSLDSSGGPNWLWSVYGRNELKNMVSLPIAAAETAVGRKALVIHHLADTIYSTYGLETRLYRSEAQSR